MAPAINFMTLRTLILRECPGWPEFLAHVTDLGLPVRLKKLEIQDHRWQKDLVGLSAMEGFLGAFQGLEELFVTQKRLLDPQRLLNSALHHRATLKRFIHPVPDALDDIPDDCWFYFFGSCDLEFIGRHCHPELLRPILRPFMSKDSLKVLHIRQPPFSLYDGYVSWAFKDTARLSFRDPDSDDGADQDVNRDVNGDDDEDDGRLRSWLRPQFIEFAEWAFGPQGIGSLQFLAFGKFAHGGRLPFGWRLRSASFILARGRGDGAGSAFRVLSERGPEARAMLEKYRDALEACPMDELLHPSMRDSDI
ncbi:1a532a71-0c79-4bda-9482-1067b3070ccc [Thermothielavioides terrestris]|nr:1a532a71-0c79-4bda-9482-1067b3070ccc [Thermothielavioides terrestris]